MKKENLKKGIPVKYNGRNRHWLGDYPTAKLTGDLSSTGGAFVEFYNASGRVVDTAWVGLDFLEQVKFTHQDTIDALTAKRDALASELSGFDAAIKALQDLG